MFHVGKIPNADDICVQLAGCSYVSKFDPCKRYWQLPLDETSKCIIAHQTPQGVFRFKVVSLC